MAGKILVIIKTCYEFEYKYESFDNFKKSANILLGDRKHLLIKNEADPVFIRSDTINDFKLYKKYRIDELLTFFCIKTM